MVALISVFFWCCYAPGLLPNWFIFLLGLVQDSLQHIPIGLSSLLYLLLAQLIIGQRRFLVRESFLGVWLVFILISGAVFLCYWGSVSLMKDAMLPPSLFIFPWLLTSLLYPAIHGIFRLLCQFSSADLHHAY